MVKYRSMIYHILYAVILRLTIPCYAENEEKQAYIVYMGKLPNEVDSLQSDHVGMISRVVEKSYLSSALVRSYKRSFNGFAAKLTPTEAHKIAGLEGVVSVFPDKILQLHTTRSWDFMGLKSTSTRKTTIESDIIIGVIDSGIWPESESFKDEDFGPPPKKWKGACKGGANFTCNNKLIGARFYAESSARDNDGHGTHTASTAAGGLIQNASFYGIAGGVARGGVPSARIAAYKACDNKGCATSDILAAFDDAIADGVDIITVSLGSDFAVAIEQDPISIGSFHAMEKGILITQSAGNNGNYWKATSSTAPWILSVAASSIDRKFVDKLVLKNGGTITGFSVNGFNTAKKFLPIVYGKEVGNTSCADYDLKSCFSDCLRREKVSRKIVLCNDPGAASSVMNKGAAGVIVPSGDPYVAYIEPLPSAALTVADFYKVVSYHEHAKNPAGKIFKSETARDLTAPLAASFSSKGPSVPFPNIMKPDVSAPGIDILAAYSPKASPSDSPADRRRVAYNVLSGTSMSCPHVAGIAAYVKSFHPDWSPTAIKSAIMTTARPMKPNKVNEFSYGSGHVDPVRALSPGLVYEVPRDDYLRLLCTSGINVTLVAGQNFTCHGLPKLNDRDMNYPSIVLTIYNGATLFSFDVSRTVRNVGPANSTYKATLVAHPKVNVTVVPDVLRFDSAHQTKSFTVSVAGSGIQLREVVSSSLVWSDGTHDVRSPIVVFMDTMGSSLYLNNLSNYVVV